MPIGQTADQSQPFGSLFAGAWRMWFEPMKRLTILFVLAALVAAAPSASALRARVWLVAASPVRVSGIAAGERVTVTVTAGKVKLRKTVSATRAGRFTTAWNGSFAGGCESTTIVARGTSGRTALWREVANDCGPPIGGL